MKRTLLPIFFSLIFLILTPVLLSAQKGWRSFNRGVKLASKENFVKAGYNFYKAYYKGYYPEFEALAYAALSSNVDRFPDVSRMCVDEAEMNAGLFIQGYSSDEDGFSSNAETEGEMEI